MLLFNFAFIFFLFFTMFVCIVFFALFLSWHSALAFSLLVLVLIGWSSLVSFARWVTLSRLAHFGLFWFVCVDVCECMCVPLVLFLFVWFCFFHLSGVLFVCFNPLYCHKNDLWVFVPQPEFRPEPLGGSIESRTLDCQRTPDPRDY